MHSKSLTGMVALLGAVVFSPIARISAQTQEPLPVIQQAGFWLWFSQYGDSEGNILDPEDFEVIMEQGNKDQHESSEQVTTENKIDENSSKDQALGVFNVTSGAEE